MGTIKLECQKRKIKNTYFCPNTQLAFSDDDSWKNIDISFGKENSCSIKQCFKSQIDKLCGSQQRGGIILVQWRKREDKKKYHASFPSPYPHILSLYMSSENNDILYVGKTWDILARLSNMFSSNKNANGVAWRIKLLLLNNCRKQSRDLSQNDLLEILDAIEIKCLFENDPIRRDFGKSYYVNKYHPILNIIWEH